MPARSSACRVLALALVLLATACAPGLRIQRYRPARYNLGSTRRVAVLGVSGQPAAAPLVFAELQRGVMNGRYFSLTDATSRGLTLVVPAAGGRVDVGGLRAQVDADVYLTAVVYRYDYAETPREETRTVNGRQVKVMTMRPEGRTAVSFQVVKSDGRVLVARDYEGSASGSAYEPGVARAAANPADLMLQALRDAVTSFLADITPRQVQEKIVLDDADPCAEPGVKLAVAGDLAGAERTWRACLAKGPNAPATFDLGVMHEARAEIDEAAKLYRQALEQSPRDLYREALEDLERRQREAESLRQDI